MPSANATQRRYPLWFRITCGLVPFTCLLALCVTPLAGAEIPITLIGATAYLCRRVVVAVL
jgi:hypothetical protein